MICFIKNEEFCIKNEKFCIKNEKLCIKNDEFCIKNDEFCSFSFRSMDVRWSSVPTWRD